MGEISVRAIIEGIKFIHEHGVVHLDLKPDNILLKDESENSPIIDFGYSLMIKPGQKLNVKPIAISAYTAPEVIEESYGPESDIWSAGVILYELLSGSQPFSFHHEANLGFKSIPNVKARFNDDIWNNIDGRVIDLIKRMFDRDTGSRISAEEVSCLDEALVGCRDEVINVGDLLWFG